MRSSETIADAISKVLIFGVVFSAAIITVGTILLVAANGASDATPLLNVRQTPSLSGFVSGLASLQPYSIIELGAIVLIATPVSRVLISVFLFAAQKDRLYTIITLAVLHARHSVHPAVSGLVDERIRNSC
jgi:uncharacterized membrane protein